MPQRKADRQLLLLLGVAAVVALLWWAVGAGGSGSTGSGSTGSGTGSGSGSVSVGSGTDGSTSAAGRTPGGVQTSRSPATRGGSTDAATPISGLATIAESVLPSQARHTLDLIRAGGPYPYSADDGVFANRERLLPAHPRGYYREYTVVTPGSGDRGARRIISGADGDRYYTDDHYASFRQIEEGR